MQKFVYKILIAVSVISLFNIFFIRNLYSEISQKKQLIPRFASLKVSETNLRTGPNFHFPIKWQYVVKGLAVEIIDVFDVWYKIKDQDNNVGWVHKTLISNERHFITKRRNILLLRNPHLPKSVIAIIEKNVRGKILSCHGKWCEVKVNKYTGWISQQNLWGTYLEEEI